jgi:hypothetical protein
VNRFRSLNGITPKSYQIYVRMKWACNTIALEPGRKLESIAADAGMRTTTESSLLTALSNCQLVLYELLDYLLIPQGASTPFCDTGDAEQALPFAKPYHASRTQGINR